MKDEMARAAHAVRIVLVAHVPLASALKAVARHVHEDCASELLALDVPAAWSGEKISDELQSVLGTDTGRPTLFLVDVLGASPSNAVMKWLSSAQSPAAAVHGVNVPMLWRALAYRHEPLPALVDRAVQGGSVGIVVGLSAD